MHLVFREIADWPKLCWIAKVKCASTSVTVLHGPCVEINPLWCVEAVWPGTFEEGDFDLSDVVVGTGLRVRAQSIIFVSSSDTLNRLLYYKDDDALYVSNSLPALLAVADLCLISNYDYVATMTSIVHGLVRYDREIPTSRSPVRQLYFNNLLVTKIGVQEIAKPSRTPDFEDFATYRDYLLKTAKRCGGNSSSDKRRHNITPLATISRGYDSPAVTVLAREAGARHAATISSARRVASNLFYIDDSGAEIAAQLGLSCSRYDRHEKEYPYEDAVWSVMGNVGDVNLSLFDYPSPLCLLFTGFIGDVLWNKTTAQWEPLQRRDTSGARFSECRLELGVFNCAPAFWGCKNEQQILAISHLPEMDHWVLGNDYDRPIPRRIVEEAGVPRNSFGIKKRASSFNRKFGRPLSVSLREDFAVFMESHGLRPTSSLSEKASLGLRALDSIVVKRLPEALRLSCSTWIRLPDPNMFLIWGNERRKNRYLASLRQATKRGDFLN